MSDLQDIHDEHAAPIIFVRGGDRRDITAIFSDVPADVFQGNGATARHVSFEIRMASLPYRPQRGDRIEHVTGIWTQIDTIDRLDIEAWTVSVEKTA